MRGDRSGVTFTPVRNARVIRVNAPWEDPSPDLPPRGFFVDAPEGAKGGPV